MMSLRAFLLDNKITIKEFCEKNGFNYQSFRIMLIGRYKPSPKLALRISEATRGKVTVMELLYPENKKEDATWLLYPMIFFPKT